MWRWVLASVVALSLVACPAPEIAGADAGESERDGGSEAPDAGAVGVDGGDGGAPPDSGAGSDGGPDASVPPTIFDTVRGTGFQYFVHGPSADDRDVRIVPPPTVLYEVNGDFFDASVRVVDAGFYEFEVPADGGYYVRVELRIRDYDGIYWWAHSSSRQIDLGNSEIGRFDAGTFDYSGPFILDAGNFVVGPLIEVTSPHAPASLHAYNCRFPVQPNTCEGIMSPDLTRPNHWIDPSRGDVTYVVLARGIAPPSFSKELQRLGWTDKAFFTQGDASYVEVELHYPDAGYDVTLDVPAFMAAAYRGLVHPAAVASTRWGQFQAVTCRGIHVPFDQASRTLFHRGVLDFFSANFDSSAGVWAHRYPFVPLPGADEWSSLVECRANYDVPLGDGGVLVNASSGGIYELTEQGPTVVTVDLRPPRDLRVDGVSSSTASPWLAKSTSPVLSWEPPASGPAPNKYSLAIGRLTSNADWRYAWSIVTDLPRVVIPPGVLEPGAHYFFVVESRIDDAPTSPNAPFAVPRTYRHAAAVSELWRAPP